MTPKAIDISQFSVDAQIAWLLPANPEMPDPPF